MLDEAFLDAVAHLEVPEMGTENVGPLLYWLLRTLRPRRVLEVGMGYTTPFLARALHDNHAAVTLERRALARRRLAEAPLMYPDFYAEEHAPRLVCVDRMTDPNSSAAKVARILDSQGLSRFCEVTEGDARDLRPQLEAKLEVIDFAWIDTWNTLGFIRDYWDLIDPAGGILAIHWLMTYPPGRAVIRYLESMRAVEGGRLEILNLREPHKVAQNSLTLVRRVRDYVDPVDLRPDGDAQDHPDSLRRDGAARRSIEL